MRILCSIALLAALVCGAKLKDKQQETVEDRIGKIEAGMLHMSVQFNSMVRSMARITKHLKIEKDGNKATPTRNGTEINRPLLAKQMNDSDLEERVSTLEMQMMSVLNDIETIEGDQSVQDYRLDEAEGKIETIQADVTSIEESITELAATDENLLESITGLVATDESLQGSISDLEQTDQEVAGEIDDLSSSVNSLSNSVDSLDTRLSKLEVDGAVAFHAYLGTYSSIFPGSVVVFPYVLVNLGDGYDGSTGRFTVPSGGAGLYYLYVHCMYDIGDWVYIGIRKNGAILCYATNDDLIEAQDHDASSCGAVSVLDEGESFKLLFLQTNGNFFHYPFMSFLQPVSKFIALFFPLLLFVGDTIDLYSYKNDGDSTPLFSTSNIVNSFTGFRIAPQ